MAPAGPDPLYENSFAAGLRQTRRFIAASEFTKGEMVARLGLRADTIHVTYQAPRRQFRRAEPDDVRPVLAELGLPASFFLYVGTLEPRKNVPGLLAGVRASAGGGAARAAAGAGGRHGLEDGGAGA